MSKIRAPRKPQGENLKVTVANQEHQIMLLVDRVEQLSAERDKFGERAEALSDENRALKTLIEERAISRMQGWQDCAREIFSEHLK